MTEDEVEGRGIGVVADVVVDVAGPDGSEFCLILPSPAS
jgi:hypothetical protein